MCRLIGYWPSFTQIKAKVLGALNKPLLLNNRNIEYVDNANDLTAMQVGLPVWA